jgi:hypothetical protein
MEKLVNRNVWTYDFNKEARECTTVVGGTIVANDNLSVPPQPFVHNEEYYNQPSIDFKVEPDPIRSYNDQSIVIAGTIVGISKLLHVVHHPYPNSSIPFLWYCTFCCVKQG